ncbi:MAG: hypothetical protein ABF651_11220 [Sporolactobacillus sp.]
MKREIEKLIVKAFFRKKIQPRILYELFSQKKRDHAMDRLNHRYMEMLRQEFMIELPKPNSDPKEIARILRKYGAGDICYSIVWSEMDGRVLPLESTLDKVVGNGSAVIVSCIHGKIAYFEAEQEYGPPPRYILKRD